MSFCKLLFISLLFFSCSQKGKDSLDSENSIEEETTIDSEENKGVQVKRLNPEEEAYVAYVNYLEETDEYSFLLGFKNEESWGVFDSLTQLLDKIVYQDESENYTRYHVPMDLVKKLFDTHLFHDIKLYDIENRFAGNAKISRYEFIEQNINSEFRLVVKLPKANHKTALYAVAGLKDTLPSIKPDRKGDHELREEIISMIRPKGYKDWDSGQIGLNGVFYTYSSAYNENYRVVSSLYETVNGKSKLLYKIKEDDVIFLDVFPLPLFFNEKQVLLATMGVFESDYIVSNVMFFDGTKYENARKYGRVGK